MIVQHYNRHNRYEQREIRSVVDSIALNDPIRYPAFAKNAAPIDLGESPAQAGSRQKWLTAITVFLAVLILWDTLDNSTLGAELLLIPAFLGCAGWLAWELKNMEVRK